MAEIVWLLEETVIAIHGNGDSAAWKELVQRYGFEVAKGILRNGFIRNDPNLDDELIH